jgi:hypothetical protein
LHGRLNICSGFVDLFLLTLYSDLDGGRLRTNLLQKSLRRVKLGGERIPILLVGGGRRWLEMGKKILLIIQMNIRARTFSRWMRTLATAIALYANEPETTAVIYRLSH